MTMGKKMKAGSISREAFISNVNGIVRELCTYIQRNNASQSTKDTDDAIHD